ncbi:DUF2339 domain-containing protein [Maribellus sediminis]|uniref:DUF2339 domain-containing protein n=1 Tax=Maribellus sediminis TaxID=2696285 RepID=UPI001431D1BC|nr:DUF2339 domain-containing protein [Maribellus sediminis]
MSVNRSEKQELLEKLNELRQKQTLFQQEINELQRQITQLSIAVSKPQMSPEEVAEKQESPIVQKEETTVKKIPVQKPYVRKDYKKQPGFWEQTRMSSEIEQFIGTNLINKIGMIVVIIGVGIGAKYAIDNNLISPLMRIVLGYLVGVILGFFAYRLKKDYYNFSAVLASGAMAIFYFISYAAYTYYQLYSYPVAFILMVIFTVLTVSLALYYDRQVIAHFALAGSYIVPFILYAPESSALVLFSYMAIINLGILFIATKKRWVPLYYLAFVATWIIFIWWFVTKDYNNRLELSLPFSSFFFVLFYFVFLSYKLILKEKSRIDDIFFLLLNSVIFYLVGLQAITDYMDSDKFQGLFTFANAVVHGAAFYFIFKSEAENKNLLFWTGSIAIAFFTGAIGLQFSSYLAAAIWAVEGAFLFWIGRKREIKLFDYLAFAVLCISFFGAISNWLSMSYSFHSSTIEQFHTSVLNGSFISSLVLIGAFAFVSFYNRKIAFCRQEEKNWIEIFDIFFNLIFAFTLYFTFYSEIDLFWNNLQIQASYEQDNTGVWIKMYEQLNTDIFAYRAIWLINYSLLFISLLIYTNFRWIKNNLLNGFLLIAVSVFTLIFLLNSLSILSGLRDSYTSDSLPNNYSVNIFHLLIRYVAYLFFALLLYAVYRFSLPFLTNKNFSKILEMVISISIIWICSSELIHWLNLTGSSEVYKHGLSILWGILSFLLIGFGIWKKKKHLRITAIILFGGTILKLFFFDLSNLATVPKTIVFISIGAILLIVSFMYNKYKNLIFGND